MKGIVYKCEICGRWTDDPYTERWIEVTANGTGANILRSGISILKIIRDEPLHFCSIKCLLEYIVSKFSENDNEDYLTDRLIEIIEGGTSVEIGNVKVTPIEKFALELNVTLPTDIWKKEVCELGIDPEDYRVLQDDESNSKLVNIYKIYYEQNH